MDFLSIQTTLETELNTKFSATTKILFENTMMEASDITGLYIIPEVIPNINNPIEYGYNRAVNSVGIFSIKVIGNFGEGTGTVITKASELLNHFSDKVFNNVHTNVGNIQKLGIIENRYQVSVLIPYNSYQK